MKRKIRNGITFLLLSFSLVFVGCDNTDPNCICIELHLKEKPLSDLCKSYLDGKSDEEIKEDARKCFGDDLEDFYNVLKF
ncbi:MAG: hypothetical protein JJT77_10210 [Crocinitomicaceae bacterium]|nr:hypothetical protein [Crocinitomicaceae bacterium]